MQVDEEADLPIPSTRRLLALNAPEWHFNLSGFVSAVLRGLGLPGLTFLFGIELMVMEPIFNKSWSEHNFATILKTIFQTHLLKETFDVVLNFAAVNISVGPIDSNSTLIQVMTCPKLATLQYLSQWWPNSLRYIRLPKPEWIICCFHYNDVTMSKIASQITSLTIAYSTVYSGPDQTKHQSSTSLAFVWGIHRGPVNSPYKWPVTRKMFPFDDVIMFFYAVAL